MYSIYLIKEPAEPTPLGVGFWRVPLRHPYPYPPQGHPYPATHMGLQTRDKHYLWLLYRDSAQVHIPVSITMYHA